jgi:hypothetical protein
MTMSEPVTTPDPNVPAGMLEADVVKRARRGDLLAYDELVKRYQERIYATLYHMTGNHEDANDLAQEAFIKAFSALKSFRRLQFLHLALPHRRQQDHQFSQAAEK